MRSGAMRYARPPAAPAANAAGNTLFRPAAQRARHAPSHGAIVLARPPAHAVLTIAGAGIAVALLCFLVFGTYTSHTTLSGRLVADPGVIKVHAPQRGTVVEKHVAEGDTVEPGDVLYAISSERVSSALGDTRASIGRLLAAREDAIVEQMELTRRLGRAHRESIEGTRATLDAEAAHLASMIAAQHERAELARDALQRYERMVADGFVSHEHVAGKRQEWMEQRSRLGNLERELGRVERERLQLAHELESAPIEYRSRVAELERSHARNRQELMENEAMRRITVTAPAPGTVTAVIGTVGQAVDASLALASIVPHAARLDAHLFAPSGAVGFMAPGDTVLLRLQAYPYQSFGHHEGTVASVSRAVLSAAELDPGAGVGRAAEPMYRVTVALASQQVEANGRTRDLRAGMALEADVLQETRRLYEWVFDPLHKLLGRTH